MKITNVDSGNEFHPDLNNIPVLGENKNVKSNDERNKEDYESSDSNYDKSYMKQHDDLSDEYETLVKSNEGSSTSLKAEETRKPFEVESVPKGENKETDDKDRKNNGLIENDIKNNEQQKVDDETNNGDNQNINLENADSHNKVNENKTEQKKEAEENNELNKEENKDNKLENNNLPPQEFDHEKEGLANISENNLQKQQIQMIIKLIMTMINDLKIIIPQMYLIKI